MVVGALISTKCWTVLILPVRVISDDLNIDISAGTGMYVST